MIHYLGTPMGGKLADRRLVLAGRAGLVPFNRRDDLALVLELCTSFIADNGAYRNWRQGYSEYHDYAGYVQWVRELMAHANFAGAVIPDHIAGTEHYNNQLLAQWPDELRAVGIPVGHMHHSLDRWRWLAQNYATIAIGGGEGYERLKSKHWWARIHDIFEAICDDQGRPLCQLHGLRLLDPKVFGVLPLTSGDSSNAARNSSRPVANLSRGERACRIADRIAQQPVAQVWTRPRQQKPFVY